MRKIFMIMAVISLSGCIRTVYVPRETVRTEYKEADTTQIFNRILRMIESERTRELRSDSLLDKEKETIVLNERGDTARHDRLHIVYKFTNRENELIRTVERQDSLIGELHLRLKLAKADSVQVPYPMEKKLSMWERAKMDYGGMCILIVMTICVLIVIWIKIK